MGKLGIVSKDTGFKAVQDYWVNRARPARNIVLCDSIEQGILGAKEPGGRFTAINESLQVRSIPGFFSEYEKRRKLWEKLREIYVNTPFSNRIADMEDMIKTDKTARLLYLDTLHRFGRKDGLILYQSLKTIAGL